MTDTTPSDPTFFGFSETVQRRLVLAALAAYVLGFVVLWPNALLVSDEAHYVGQAVMFAHGEVARDFRDVLAGTVVHKPLSTYPIGTSALEAVFVKLGGSWRFAHLASLLTLCGAVLVLLRWMRELRRPPIFALLPLVFIGTVVPGRLAMSDAPTALISALTFWLFWRGTLPGARTAFLGAGFFAGLSAAFRDPTVVLFTPLFAGAVLRRTPRWWQLVVGGLVGLSARLVGGKLLFGSALFLRQGGGGGTGPLTWAAVAPNVPLYLFILAVAIPFGLVSVWLSKDARRIELNVGVLGMLAVYLLFPLPHEANSIARDIVVHSRYASALVALMAYTLSEVVPRLLAGRIAIARALAVGAVAGAIVLGAATHVYLHRWGATLARITDTIYTQTPEGVPFLTSVMNTSKFLSEAFGHRDWVDRSTTTPDAIADHVARVEPMYAVFVHRTEVEARRAEAEANLAFLDALRARCRIETIVDRQESEIERLLIAKIASCEPRPTAPN